MNLLQNAVMTTLASTTMNLEPTPVDWDSINAKLTVALIGVFGILTLYYISIIWKHGLAIARSGDNPQQLAQAKAGLMSAIIGGVIFFGATTVAGLAMYLAQ